VETVSEMSVCEFGMDSSLAVKLDWRCNRTGNVLHAQSNTEVASCNLVAVEKHSYSENVFVALSIQMKRARAILSSVAGRAIQYFSTLSHKWHDLKKKPVLKIKCVSYVYWTVHHLDS